MAVLKELLWKHVKISSSLTSISQSCPLKSFLMGSYYAAETFLKAAPTRDQKLNMLCNTTVQLQQRKTNRGSSALLCIAALVLSVLCHGQLLVAGISWPLPVFKRNTLAKPTNNSTWDNPAPRVHHSYSQHVIYGSCSANSASALPLNVQLHPRSKGIFLKPPFCQFCWKASACSLWDSGKGVSMWGDFSHQNSCTKIHEKLFLVNDCFQDSFWFVVCWEYKK